MSIQNHIILSEYALVKFNVHGQTYSNTHEGISSFVQGLLLTNDTASFVFTEVVACRAIVMRDTITRDLFHDLSMWNDKGPFTSEQFLQIMQYDHSITNGTWEEHMLKWTRTSL